ncbi:hypothetical protein PQC07_gp222 [Aeromonas phage D3]|nr:hypothetical protein PQC07_gp222 [Aeromonas phage D3]YP_010668799.1 hypothetical protein PQC08_gp224 [Aeromonas phage D6]QDJ97050.1 hypothetical protein D3_0053 [Aeromonas phage D3]QDJ97211.1 hypothetical protein D6_0051 [Aeromonas phage D6]QEP52356.1 hypothetical protein D9_0149 [Aeromonas phage D9]
MANGCCATMSTVGYLYEPLAQIDRLIAWWFANRIDQSVILTDIQSYQYVVASHQNDFRIDEFLQDVQRNLQSYLMECFEGAEVKATAPNYEEGGKMFHLHISGVVERNGVRYDVASAVALSGKTFELVENGRKRIAR